MTDEMVGCSCGWKGCKSTLYKTDGYCPKCGRMLDLTINTNVKAPRATQEQLKSFSAVRA
jgi:uncharacterized Zn finger protein (UPF0148 family)